MYRSPEILQFTAKDTDGNILFSGTARGHTITRNADGTTEIDLEINQVAEVNASALRCMVERRPVVGTIQRFVTEQTVQAALEGQVRRHFLQGTVWAQQKLRNFAEFYGASDVEATRILGQFDQAYPALQRWRDEAALRGYRPRKIADKSYCGGSVEKMPKSGMIRTTHFFDLEDQW